LGNKYELWVQDMFHYGDPEYRDYKIAEFDTEKEAIEAAENRILNSFERNESGEENYKKWLMFGEDAYILSPIKTKKVDFSGPQFVKKICNKE
jgi:hypothetical protein